MNIHFRVLWPPTANMLRRTKEDGHISSMDDRPLATIFDLEVRWCLDENSTAREASSMISAYLQTRSRVSVGVGATKNLHREPTAGATISTSSLSINSGTTGQDGPSRILVRTCTTKWAIAFGLVTWTGPLTATRTGGKAGDKLRARTLTRM
jgi:hypothetical protein